MLLAAVKATTAALQGNPLGDLGAWLQLLAAFDLVMIVAGAVTYGPPAGGMMTATWCSAWWRCWRVRRFDFALFIVPADANQGDAQRIMAASSASVCLPVVRVTALAGIAYLWRRDLRFDAVALAGAEIGVMFTAFAIWGGMMWGRPVWASSGSGRTRG